MRPTCFNKELQASLTHKVGWGRWAGIWRNELLLLLLTWDNSHTCSAVAGDAFHHHPSCPFLPQLFSSSGSSQYPLPAGQKTRNDRWPGNSPSFLGQKLARGGPDCQVTCNDVRAQHNQKTPANQATKDFTAEKPLNKSQKLLFPPQTPFL